jgi:glycosyltransferase involved in cell wall biosynthesis
VNGTPLSFCMVTTFYPPHNFGGDGIYVHRLSNELAARGHEVTVVSTPDAHELLGGSSRDAPNEHENVNLAPLSSRHGRLSPLVTYLSGRPGLRAPQLRELFQRRRFDVVHFHNVSLVGGPGVLSYGEGVKLYTTHEHWLVCPMHTLWRLDREPCERPTCLRCTLAYRRPPQLWRYTGLLGRQAEEIDLFLAPSLFTLEAHKKRGFRGAMVHLPHFFPLGDAGEGQSDTERPLDRPYFLVVGRLERLKGVQTLIEAFRHYDAADLVVVGEGTYGAELRRQAAELRHIRFLGHLPSDSLNALYGGAIALIAPSIGYETFGMTPIEAFARGTPAIVRDLGGLPEVVNESGGGFIYRTQDELVQAMEALRSQPGLRTELGERGYRAFRERWSPEPHLRAYFDFIDQVAERRAVRPRALLDMEGEG